jgi:hypothetical protein
MEVINDQVAFNQLYDEPTFNNLLDAIDYSLLLTLNFNEMKVISSWLVKGVSFTLNRYI